MEHILSEKGYKTLKGLSESVRSELSDEYEANKKMYIDMAEKANHTLIKTNRFI